MAKKIVITNDNCNDLSVAKSATYVLGNVTNQINFTGAWGEEISSNFYKSGNDLILTTITTSDHKVKKTTTQTIKDFFAESTTFSNKVYNGSTYVKKDSSVGFVTEGVGELYTTFTGKEFIFTHDEADLVYGNNKSNIYSVNNDADYSRIIDLKGNETYNITEGYRINDYYGNDKYNVTSGYLYRIFENSGNDKYTLIGGKIGLAADYSGNDKYDISKNSDLFAVDSKGNDKYTVDLSTLYAKDRAGKDSYTVSNGSNIYIEDNGESNDTYNIASAITRAETTTAIIDNGGNDKFTLENVGAQDDDTFRVSNAKGKDSYTIKGEDYLEITDDAGSDTYKFTNVNGIIEIDDKGGSNKFTVKDSEFSKTKYYGQLYFDNTGESTDKKHNDTYTLTNVTGDHYQNSELNINTGFNQSIVIKDEMGEDKFNLTNTTSAHLEVTGTGKDTYTMKNSKDIEVVTRGDSNDKYTFTSTDTDILDKLGNDTYTFKKLDGQTVLINDQQGTDKLVISGEKFGKDKVVAVASGIGKNSSSGTGDLFLYDVASKGWTRIHDFYSVDSDKNLVKGGIGEIETVKIGNKTIKLSGDAIINDLNNLNAQVQGWLTNTTSHDFSTVNDVFLTGSEAEIHSLVTACFNGQNA